MLDMQDQVVLITGASRGLGLAVARECAKQGAKLVICAREPEPLEVARWELSDMGAEVLSFSCDVGDREQVQSMIEQSIIHFKHIDVLINNAGIINVGPQETMIIPDYEEAMNTMFWESVYTTLAVLPYMREEKRGRIVNITSVGGKVSVPHLLPYSSAKFAAIGFSEGLHAELAKEGINVTTVVPGLMRTGSHVNAYFKGKQQAEYAWFSLAATLPITSTDAANAARRIVRATRRGDAEVILTIQAKLLVLFHGLFPGLTTEILGLVNRVLPDTNGTGKSRKTGRESRNAVATKLTALGEPAAHNYNQYSKPD
jgi:short-subunit dehydrogenase